jgi:hypothetical protein
MQGFGDRNRSGGSRVEFNRIAYRTGGLDHEVTAYVAFVAHDAETEPASMIRLGAILSVIWLLGFAAVACGQAVA